MLTNSIYVIEELLKFDNEIKYIRDIDESTIALIDSEQNLFLVDKVRYSISGITKLNIPKDIISLYISNDSKIYYIKKDSPHIFCHQIAKGKTTQVETYNTTNLTGMLFSKDNRFLLLFTKSNRVLIYTLPDLEYFSYVEFANGNISKYFFSLDSNLLVVVLDTKKVIIYDLVQQKISDSFDLQGKVSDGFIYNDNNNIFFTFSEGEYNYCKYDLIKKELNISKNRFFPLKSCYTDKNQNTVLCGTEQGMMFLVNLKNMELLYSLVFDTGINKIRENNKVIMILLNNSQLYFFNKNAGLEETLNKLELKEYGEAFNYIKNNIFLYMNPKVLTNINIAWDQLYKRALHFMGEGKVELAKKMLEAFLTIKSKKQKYDLAVNDLDVIKNFNEEVRNRKYKNAYLYVLEHSFLKDSLNYSNLEKNWEVLFEKVQKDFLVGKHNIKASLKPLAPFLDVKEKQKIITLILENYDVFTKANDAIRGKNFHLFYRYCDKYEFLKNTSLYSKTEELGKTLYQKILTVKSTEKDFKFLADILKHFPTYKSKVEMLENYGTIKNLFTKAIEDRNIKQIYHLIHENSFLYVTEVYKDFINAVINDFDSFILNVKVTNFEESYLLIEPYFGIDFWHNKVDMYMQFYYYEEILVMENEKDKLNAIENYQEIFGNTLVVEYFSKMLNLTLKPKQRKPMLIRYSASILDYGR